MRKSLKEYIKFFESTCSSLPEDYKQKIIKILSNGKPRDIFLVLEELRIKGVIQSKQFDDELTEFYWSFC